MMTLCPTIRRVTLAACMMMLVGLAPPPASSSFQQMSVSELLVSIAGWSGVDDDSDGSSAWTELYGRLRRGDLDDEQLKVFLDASYRGDAMAAPMTQTWRAKYLHLLRTYWRKYAKLHLQELSSTNVPMYVNVNTAGFFPENLAGVAEIPAGVEFPIRIKVEAAWRPSLGNYVRCRAELPSAAESTGHILGDVYVIVPPQRPGRVEVPIRTDVLSVGGDGVLRLVQSQTVNVPCNFVNAEWSTVKLGDVESIARDFVKSYLTETAATVEDAAYPEGVRVYGFLVDWSGNAARRPIHRGIGFGASINALDKSGVVIGRSFVASGEFQYTWDGQVFDPIASRSISGLSSVLEIFPVVGLLAWHRSDASVGKPSVYLWNGKAKMALTVIE